MTASRGATPTGTPISARGAGLPRRDRGGRGVPGLCVHAVRRPPRRCAGRLLRRRRRAHGARPCGVRRPASWGAVASLSPELFLRRVGDTVDVEPDQGHAADRRAHPSALRASVKDVAENIMIVDLVRNDLGRVALTGTVTVPELLAVRPAPGVWHLVSTVSARVDVDVPMAPRAGRDVPACVGDRHAEDPGPSAVDRMGASASRNLLRHGRFGVTRRGYPSSTSRSAPSSSTPPAARCLASAAASPPTPIPTASGRSACTRQRQSLGVQPAPVDEYPGQPFRLADHRVWQASIGMMVCGSPSSRRRGPRRGRGRSRSADARSAPDSRTQPLPVARRYLLAILVAELRVFEEFRRRRRRSATYG